MEGLRSSPLKVPVAPHENIADEVTEKTEPGFPQKCTTKG